ncbi:unnamed protein product [Mycena citricolor]|uniref:Uncharacterized protein n=1 Tax=Mycena citricolor TaxID=2018698 RepID=A0AAD2GXE7_9AGAR|nr:unnamed protein product [Mycena citricolor]
MILGGTAGAMGGAGGVGGGTDARTGCSGSSTDSPDAPAARARRAWARVRIAKISFSRLARRSSSDRTNLAAGLDWEDAGYDDDRLTPGILRGTNAPWAAADVMVTTTINALITFSSGCRWAGWQRARIWTTWLLLLR